MAGPSTVEAFLSSTPCFLEGTWTVCIVWVHVFVDGLEQNGPHRASNVRSSLLHERICLRYAHPWLLRRWLFVGCAALDCKHAPPHLAVPRPRLVSGRTTEDADETPANGMEACETWTSAQEETYTIPHDRSMRASTRNGFVDVDEPRRRSEGRRKSKG